MASNISKLQHPNKKQFLLTVPQALARAKRWEKGDEIEFVFDEEGNLLLRKKRGAS